MPRVICFRRDMFDAIIARRKTETRRLSGRWMSLKLGETVDARIGRGKDEGLRLTVVRRDRVPLQSIQLMDCVAEGYPYTADHVNQAGYPDPCEWFEALWDEIHKTVGETYADNPDVTVIGFELLSYDPPRQKPC